MRIFVSFFLSFNCTTLIHHLIALDWVNVCPIRHRGTFNVLFLYSKLRNILNLKCSFLFFMSLLRNIKTVMLS